MNIKIKNTFAFCILIPIFISACGGCQSSGDKKIINTEIPAELSENQKVKEYFHTLEQVIDEYATMIENLSESSKKTESKEEPSFSDAMDMFSDVTSSALKMAPLLEKMDKLEQEGEILKDDLTNEEMKAFSKTYAKIMARFYEIGEKQELSN